MNVACAYLVVVATYASSASDVSAAGNTATNKRKILSAENVYNIVFLSECHGVEWSLENNDAVGEIDKQEVIPRLMRGQIFNESFSAFGKNRSD